MVHAAHIVKINSAVDQSTADFLETKFSFDYASAFLNGLLSVSLKEKRKRKNTENKR